MSSPGLYVHVPFCARRCPYCDFYSISALDLIPRYLQALASEAAKAAPFWGEFETLYIGGGSPSLLNEKGLEGLFKALAPLNIGRLKEITFEANPEDVTSIAAAMWAETGITRLSLGTQSFDDRWLADVLARGHSAADNYKAVEILKQQGFDLSLDLIYGHPSQDMENWGADLNKAVALRPEHISTYSLTVENNTALARSIKEGFLPRVPPPDQVADMFLLAGQALAMGSYQRYEVSNFALPGHESKHNLKYWRREAYLGLGPSAHSFDGKKRWANAASVRQWHSALKSGANAHVFMEELSQEAIRLERLMLGLRLTEGVALSVLQHSPKLEEFISLGYLARCEDRIVPTEKGLLVADRLAVEL